eukprot:1159931-Pelagomonas_calceolata.AAC.12
MSDRGLWQCITAMHDAPAAAGHPGLTRASPEQGTVSSYRSYRSQHLAQTLPCPPAAAAAAAAPLAAVARAQPTAPQPPCSAHPASSSAFPGSTRTP